MTLGELGFTAGYEARAQGKSPCAPRDIDQTRYALGGDQLFAVCSAYGRAFASSDVPDKLWVKLTPWALSELDIAFAVAVPGGREELGARLQMEQLERELCGGG